jgi:hypothetical protein
MVRTAVLLSLLLPPLSALAAETVKIGKTEIEACAPYGKLPLFKKISAEKKSFNSIRDQLNITGVDVEILRQNYQQRATQVGGQVEQIKQNGNKVTALLCAGLKPAAQLEELLPDAMSGMSKLGEERSATKGRCSEQLRRALFIVHTYRLDYAGGCASQ